MIGKVCRKLLYIFLDILLIGSFFVLSNDNISQLEQRQYWLLPIYYTIMISEILFVNYFGTRSYQMRLCIERFLDSLDEFFSNRFCFNLLLITLLIIFKNISNVFTAIVSSYIFYFLTEVYKIYSSKNSERKKIPEYQLAIQAFIIAYLIFHLRNIEVLFNYIAFGRTLDIHYNIQVLYITIFLSLAIGISHVVDYYINYYRPAHKNKC